MPLHYASIFGSQVMVDPYNIAQTLVGTNGDDTIHGSVGHDTIYGLEGKDTLVGYEGNDRLEGEGGDDVLFGSYGHDTVNGGTGDDELHGGYGDDVISGDAGDDKIYGDAGDDKLFGGDGTDRLWGHDGTDVLHGGDGSDILDGGAGNDRLFGGNGADVLNGGSGINRLYGGAGRDLFVIDTLTVPGSTYTYILDFEPHGPGGDNLMGDLIDLRALFDQHTNFAGNNADEAWAQKYLYFEQFGEEVGAMTTYVYLDFNGNAPDITPDVGIAALAGVASDQLGAIGQDFLGYSHHFLV